MKKPLENFWLKILALVIAFILWAIVKSDLIYMQTRL